MGRNNRFPDRLLKDLGGVAKPVLSGSDSKALLILGHKDCPTTRLALPYVDRIYRRRKAGTSALAILQDTPEEARALVGELSLDLPVRIEEDPYPLAAALGIKTVPTLLLCSESTIERVSEGFRKEDFETLAEEMGVSGLFDAADHVPALRPG